MSENQEIIDRPSEFGSSGTDSVLSKRASSGKRFANSIIDTIVFYILLFLVGVFSELFTPGIIVEESGGFGGIILTYGVLLLYFWVMESTTGKTIGKYVTKTKVVKSDGSRPTAYNVLGRTLCRFIPFDAFSYLGSSVRGWHDTIPDVYVIEE